VEKTLKMSLTGENITEIDIKRYVFAEMPDDEREAFEEMVFVDDELFFEIADVENRLVDGYVAGDLNRDELTRFQRSLEVMPARREKIANARSLNTYIGEERPAEVREALSQPLSVWQRIASVLGGGSPSFAYAMAAAVLLLAVATGLLFLQNQRKNAELARLQDVQARQGELQSELDRSRQRESELQSAIDAERDTSGDLQDELDRERSRREDIERQLGNLKDTNTAQPGPIIASAMLFPIGARGGQGGTIPTIKIGRETKRLSMRLGLPDNITQEDRLTVRLNLKVTAREVIPRISGNNKSVNVSVPVKSLNKGRNELDVLDAAGRTVSSYGLNVVER
jgi:hypothetical protein